MRVHLLSSEGILYKVIREFLEHLNHEVEIFNIDSYFNEGKLQPDEKSKADLVIVDLDLPVEPAVEYVRKANHKQPKADIIVLSSVLPYEKAIEYGVYSHLRKPVRLDELQLLLKRLEESRKLSGRGA